MPILTANERLGTEVGGRYRLDKIIGEGGFSAVFSAEHLMTGRTVALKLLHAHLVQTEQVSTRFLIEAQTMAKIRHPGIVQVLDAGREDDGAIFIALELLEGETLEAVLARCGRLTLHEAARITSEVLDALTAAHVRNVVHRDIKPANIFLAREADGSTISKVLDFGIAHVVPKGGGKLTTAGVILGTPEYMSPEQARGGAIDARGDLWSMGIVLFELLTGTVPWTSESATALLMAIASEPLCDIRQLAPELPASLCRVIERVLEKDPDRRYSSAAEMRFALAEAMHAAEEDPSGEFGAITRSGRPSGSLSPTPVPAARPRATNEPASARFSVPGMIAGSAREFEWEANASDVSLDLAEGAEDVVRRTPSYATFQAIRPPPNPATASARESASSAADEFDLPMPPPPPPPPPPSRAAAPLVDTTARSVATRASLAPPGLSPTPASRTIPPPASAVTSAHRGMPPSASAASANRALGSASGPGSSAHAAMTFSAPAKSRTGLWLAVGALAAVGAIGAAFALRQRGHVETPRAYDAGGGAITHDAATAPPPPGPVRELAQRYTITAPFGTDHDGRRAFGRHMAVGPARAGATRAIATCTRTQLFLYTGGDGLPAASGPAEIACEQHDLALVPDLDGDGQDDVAAVTRGHDGVVFISTHTLRPIRTVPVPYAQGLVGPFSVRGEPAVAVYAEPGGPMDATEVAAVGARTGQVLWRTQGRGDLTRIGHPSELGLATGGDATGDGVDDVVVGSTAPNGAPRDRVPARPRCVELLSGATGARAWAEPFCQSRGGAQSVSLGPDVDGDGRGDVAVGTDVVRGSEPPVVLISGADAHVLRRIGPFAGAGARGFGWPVFLGDDVDADGAPELAVGSVGSEGTYVTLASARDGRRVATQRVPGDVGYPNLRVVIAAGLVHGETPAVMASSPEDGLHAYIIVTQ